MMIAPFLLAMLTLTPSIKAQQAPNDAYAAALAYEQVQKARALGAYGEAPAYGVPAATLGTAPYGTLASAPAYGTFPAYGAPAVAAPGTTAFVGYTVPAGATFPIASANAAYPAAPANAVYLPASASATLQAAQTAPAPTPLGITLQAAQVAQPAPAPANATLQAAPALGITLQGAPAPLGITLQNAPALGITLQAIQAAQAAQAAQVAQVAQVAQTLQTVKRLEATHATAAMAQAIADAQAEEARLQTVAAAAFTVSELRKAAELYASAQENPASQFPYFKAKAIATILDAPAVVNAINALQASAATQALSPVEKALALRLLRKIMEAPVIDRETVRHIIVVIKALEAIRDFMLRHHHCRCPRERIQIIIIAIVIRRWRENHHLLRAEPGFGADLDFGSESGLGVLRGAPAFEDGLGLGALRAEEEGAPAWGERLAALAKKEIFDPAFGDGVAVARAVRELHADDYDAKGRVILTWKEHAKILKKFAEGHSFHGKAFNVEAERNVTVACHHRRFDRRTVALSHVFFPRIEGLFHALCRPHWCIEIKKVGDRCGRPIVVRAKWILHGHVYTDIAVSQDVFTELATRIGQQYADVKFRLAECPLYLAREERE